MKKVFLISLVLLFSFSGCFLDDDKYYYATVIDGSESTQLEVMDGMGFWLVNPTTYYCAWDLYVDYASVSSLTIEFPYTVTTGSYFDQDSSDFQVYYKPEGSTVTYHVSSFSDFSLSVTRWDGIGGIAQGTFSGTLSSSGFTIDVSGTFEASIDTI